MNKFWKEYKKKDLINYNPTITILTNNGTENNTFEITIQEFIIHNSKYSAVKNSYQKLVRLLDKYFVYCQKCNKYKATMVHHLDKNHNNNKLNNLSLVCKRCHIHIHKFKPEKEMKILFDNA